MIRRSDKKQFQSNWTKRGETSRRAVIMIILIVAMSLYIVYLCSQWYTVRVARGDDKLMVNTAESVARINSNNGLGCPVDGCEGGECPHWTGRSWIGYFDNVSNKVVGTKPAGYNEYRTMEVNGQKYYGEAGTMVIKVVSEDSTVTLSWERGGTA